MARRNRLLRHNILIVCEGESTEPQYFDNLIPLAKAAWADSHKLYIEISPKPKLVEEETDDTLSKHKTARKRRQIKPVVAELPDIEEEYKAVPVRYVRAAQQGLEDETYEETWAVFDKDYHPRHQQAFELSEQEVEGKRVQIAFSSISFEQWILLHFEKSLTAFVKSECKEGKVSLKCGENLHQNDCFGERCACGYIKTTQYLVDYDKGAAANYFEVLHENFPQALENAAWLRHQVLTANPETPLYELNPYTNLDYLVKHLLQIHEEIVWMDFGITKEFDDFTISFLQVSAELIASHFTNNSSISSLISPNQLFTIRNDEHQYFFDANILIPVGETSIISMDISNDAGNVLNFSFIADKNYRIMIDL